LVSNADEGPLTIPLIVSGATAFAVIVLEAANEIGAEIVAPADPLYIVIPSVPIASAPLPLFEIVVATVTPVPLGLPKINPSALSLESDTCGKFV
jgi:hypothetical protein